MKSFDELWRFIVNRSQGFPTVQEYHELEHVFNLMQGCESYLEVGTAEGNSLYVLSHSIDDLATIALVDYGEEHTSKPRSDILKILSQNGYICEFNGNSHNPKIIRDVSLIRTHGTEIGMYEAVLIDAGHTYEDVIADAIAYGSLATKYIFFHDVCLPEVNRAFEWYIKQRPECTAYKMINSTTFGYGVIKI